MSQQTEQPLHDLEAERYVLGSIFRNNTCIDDVLHLSPDDFYLPIHHAVFREMLRLNVKGHPIDTATVADALRSSGEIQSEADERIAGELRRDDYTTAKIKYHAKIVKRHSIRRKLIQTADSLYREACNPVDPDPNALLDTAERMVFSIRENGIQSETKPIAHYLGQTMAELDARKDGIEHGIPTGLATLDRYISFRPGQLTVIGGRPGGGKSISGLQFGIHATKQGTPTVFYSLEMSGEELAARAVSSHGSVDATYTTRKRVAIEGTEEARIANNAIDELGRLPMFINDQAWNTVHGIIADARRMKRKHKVELIIVDYLQLVQSIRSKGQLRYEQLGEITQSLKHLAKELNVHVILLAQLNRESEKNGLDKEPQLWHIKESGSAEQDADIVLLLWSTPKQEGMENIVNIKVAKNRHGMCGAIVHVRHAKEYMRFDDIGSSQRQ